MAEQGHGRAAVRHLRRLADEEYRIGPRALSGRVFSYPRIAGVRRDVIESAAASGQSSRATRANCHRSAAERRSADEVVSVSEVFAHGQIDLAGLVTSTPNGPGTFRLAVTGGTGRYQDARGYATVTPDPAPHVTIHLTP